MVVLVVANRRVPNCSDNIQNQNEIGVDCGGECVRVCALEATDLVLLWTRTLDIDGINDEFNFDFYLKVVDPTNKVIQQTLTTLSFPKGVKRLRYRIRSNAIAVTIPGSYRYDIEVKKDGKDEFENTNVIPLEIKPIASNLPIGG